MTLFIHAALPVAIAKVATPWFPIFGHYRVRDLIAIIGAAPDWLPLILWDKYKLWHSAYNKLHRPWLYVSSLGLKLLIYLSYIIFFPWGLHIVSDIPFHTDQAGLKNEKLMAISEWLLWLPTVYILSNHNWNWTAIWQVLVAIVIFVWWKRKGLI